MKLAAALLSLPAVLVVVACNAEGEMKVNASTKEDTKTEASFSAEGDTGAKSEPAKPAASKPAGSATQVTATGDPTPAARSACPLECFVAQKGRVAPADEQRLTGDLSEVMTALRACGSVGATPSLTMRFDSGAQLSGFGVDAERGNEGACVDGVRQRRPTVSFPGPSTLRCAERCPGDPSTRSRRRR